MSGRAKFLKAGAVFGAVLAGAMALAAAEDSIKTRVDTVFAPWDKVTSPGCTLGVYRDGDMVYARGYGMANLEYGIALSANSVFRIGSTSKQFTAASIMLLAKEGRISLDDDIRDYFPEFPDLGPTVTIRHMIHHISGVRDYLDLWDFAGARNDDFFTDQDVVQMLSRQKELNFDPGDKWAYSNSGYFLLGQIILRVTGKTLGEYAEDKIFKPLGMTHSHYHDDNKMIVPMRADGYARREEGGFELSMTTLEMIGDGGVFTTVGDLLLWDSNFYANELGGGAELIAELKVPAKLNDGTNTGYAFGLNIGEYRGLPTVRHGGSFVGFRAELLRFPEQHFSVAVLCNLSRTNPSDLANQVADVYLEQELGARQEASRNAQSAPERVTGAQWRPGDLAAYTGQFFNDELDVTYGLTEQDGALMLDIPNREPEPVAPGADGVFSNDSGRINLHVTRDGDGGVTGFVVMSSRVRNLRFGRVD